MNYNSCDKRHFSLKSDHLFTLENILVYSVNEEIRVSLQMYPGLQRLTSTLLNTAQCSTCWIRDGMLRTAPSSESLTQCNKKITSYTQQK